LKNKMAMCYGPLELKVEEHEIDAPRPGEIQVKIEAALTCGTDVKIYKRGYPFLTPPFPVGHEFAGIVTAVGEGMDQDLIGKRVVTSNGAGCQYCFYCMRDQDNLCEGIEEDFDEYVQMGGGFAEYINVHAPIVKQNLMTFPEDVPFESAAMVEPLSVALHGVNMAGIEIGDTVAIIGGGPMGLLKTQLSKMRGAYVIVIEKDPDRLNKAKQLGADVIINPDEVDDIVAEVKKHANDGRGADRVIEAVGIPQTWELAIELVRKGGTVVEYGGCARGTTITVDTVRLHYDEITIKGSYSASALETEIAFRLLARKMIKAEDYVSGVYSLDDVKEALDAHMNSKGVKFLIKP
jgi:Threonine dehydrogenase and related Zn-dependent dehydrogenases